MKRLITILMMLPFVVISLSSCVSKEQKISEDVLKESLKAPSTYKFISFELESAQTMGDELGGSIDLYRGYVDSDKRFIDLYEGFVNDTKDDLEDAERDRKRYGGSWDRIVDMSRKMLTENEEKLAEQKSKLGRDQRILDALVKLSETEDLSKETGRIYVLTYEAQNALGVPLRGYFRTHFKANGELVEYKSDDDAWVAIGDVFSIPGYYELIGVNGD